MHEKLIHRSRKNLEAGARAAQWTSHLTQGLEKQARDVGYEGRLSQECLDELQTFLTGLLEAQHDHLWRKVGDRKAAHDFAKLHRHRRDELTQEVYGQLVELRALIRSLLGKELEQKLFGAGQKTPREPWELARVAHNVIGFLAHPKAQDGICRGLANEALWNAAVEKMSEPLGELWKVLSELQALEGEERAAVNRLHESKDRLHQSQKHLFRLQEALCAMAGRQDLAEILRPAEPSRRQRTTDRPEAVESRQIREGAGQESEKAVLNASKSGPEASPTSPNPLKAVPEAPESLEAPASPEPSVEDSPEVDSHPVRKVLKWIQAVPHRVRQIPETPETAGSEERAA